MATFGQSDPRLLLAQQLLRPMNPQNVGQGLNAAGNSIVGALLARQGIQAQREGQEQANQAIAQAAMAIPGGGALAGSDPAAAGVASTGGAGFSTGPSQRDALVALLMNPQAMADPRAATIAQMLMPSDPQSTTAIRNFEFAQQNPAFQTFLESTSRAPSATINVAEGAFAPTRATTNRLQAETLDVQEELVRMDSIISSFEPRFLEIPTKVGMAFTEFRDKLGSITDIFGIPNLTVEQKQELADYTVFTTRTLENMNLTLNKLSGAAISPQEFERISQSLPNPDDGPTSFQAKMVDAVRQMRRSLARLNIAQARGLNPLDSGIALEGVDAIINAEGQRIRQELQNSGLAADQIEQIVAQELQRTFFGGVF